MAKNLGILLPAFLILAYSQAVNPSDDGFLVIPVGDSVVVIPWDDESLRSDSVVYYNDFSSQADGRRIDQFVAYRDSFVVNHTTGRSDHSPTGGIHCSAPEDTRSQSRESPAAHVYQCLPMGNTESGHQMAFAMDTSGYGFVGALPDQVFVGLTEVSVDINTTSAGTRNFVEIKVIPANNVYVNGLPCIPDLPCNDGWDYDDISAVGVSTDSQEGTGLAIATPAVPDGFRFDLYNSYQLSNGDTQYHQCAPSGFCFHARTHEGNTGIRQRFQHIFRDNGDGTLAFGIEGEDGLFDWVEAPGTFPSGAVRVVIAFHNYTGTKDGNGPGADSNVSPSEGGFTWHWDELSVKASSAVSSVDFFGGTSANRIVTPDDCVAFSQGQRESPNNNDVLPRFHCLGDPDLEF